MENIILQPKVSWSYHYYYNSSIIDIEHSPYYIALGLTHNHIVIYWRPTLS